MTADAEPLFASACTYTKDRPLSSPPFVSRRLLRYRSVVFIAATGRLSRSIIFSKTLDASNRVASRTIPARQGYSAHESDCTESGENEVP